MKKISKAMFVLTIVMLFAVSCSTTSTTTKEVSAPAAAVKADIKAEPVKVAEAPKTVEKKAEPAKAVNTEKTEPEKVELNLNYVYKYAGYEIDVNVTDGTAYVTYPSFITDKEIADAAYLFAKAYNIKGVTFRKVSDGKLVVSYPKGYSKADFDYIASAASKELTNYLDSMFAPKQEEENEEEMPIAAYTYSNNGVNIIIVVFDGYSIISYPEEIQDSTVNSLVGYFYKEHQNILGGVKYGIIGKGTALIKFPEGTSKEAVEYVAVTAANELTDYLK